MTLDKYLSLLVPSDTNESVNLNITISAMVGAKGTRAEGTVFKQVLVKEKSANNRQRIFNWNEDVGQFME